MFMDLWEFHAECFKTYKEWRPPPTSTPHTFTPPILNCWSILLAKEKTNRGRRERKIFGAGIIS
jgi:hypothetical protein